MKDHIALREVADVGFYYKVDGDRVVCFYCAGGLKNWEADKNPWYEHVW